MKKKLNPKRLVISQVTIRNLSASQLEHAVGGKTLVGSVCTKQLAGESLEALCN